MSTPGETSRPAFFYGTLMAPEVLHRVCHGSMSPTNPIYTTHNLKIKPAILHNHRRHRVKTADYPAIIPRPGSSVRGNIVTGLTDQDIFRLDVFEGDEYERVKVRATLLSKVGDEQGEGNVEGEEVEVETYVWKAGEQELEDEEWDFKEFQREKMRFWVGREGEGEYADVDKAVAEVDANDGTRGRGANGHITSALEAEQRKKAS
ncbi:disease resistance protein Aig2 [Zymoseptoria brevis]|uniref:Putative gamma-glutamylcyclotransferase n=1 Tax=Zymoseptoria brevis TaxID=1047168 RepID=A0A0F4GQ73_9PEZI|nr:disease resistance protein Aig2 [Zymoseptoria brevis]